MSLWNQFTLAAKVAIIVILAGAVLSIVLSIGSHYNLKEAQEQVELAKDLERKAVSEREEHARIKIESERLSTALQRANSEAELLQAKLDKVNVPPKPGPPPETQQAVIQDLKNMGLDLVIRPSIVAPAIAGLTERDAVTVWGWGKENLRVPFLEEKTKKQTEVISALASAKSLAESLAENRLKESEASLRAADLHKSQAEAIGRALTSTQKSIAADKLKKKLYIGGALLGGYVVGKKVKL